MKTWVSILGGYCLTLALLPAEASDRFAQKIKFPSGPMVVVAEGDFEPRSIGSFSVRVYSAADPRFPTDDFIAGVIRARDGFVEKVVPVDLNGDGQCEVVVIVRNAGSGSYLSAHAFEIRGKSIALKGSVAELASDADPVKALIQAQNGR